MKKFTKEWLVNALLRAIRTFAQTALSMFTIGAAFNEVDWLRILSVSGVAKPINGFSRSIPRSIRFLL